MIYYNGPNLFNITTTVSFFETFLGFRSSLTSAHRFVFGEIIFKTIPDLPETPHDGLL